VATVYNSVTGLFGTFMILKAKGKIQWSNNGSLAEEKSVKRCLKNA
jgi:hypothetical protein